MNNYESEKGLKNFKLEFRDKWEYLNEKLAYPYESINSLDDYHKTVNDLKKGDFVSKLKNKYPRTEEIERATKIIELFDIKNGEEITKLILKTDVIFLTCVFEKFLELSINEFISKIFILCVYLDLLGSVD